MFQTAVHFHNSYVVYSILNSLCEQDFKRVFLENAIDAPMGLQGTQTFGATTSSSAPGTTLGLNSTSSTAAGFGAGGSLGAGGGGGVSGGRTSGAFEGAGQPRLTAQGTGNLQYDDEYTDEEEEEEDVELEDYDDSTTAPATSGSLGGGANAVEMRARTGPATVPPPTGARSAGQAAFNGGSTAASWTTTTSTTNRMSY